MERTRDIETFLDEQRVEHDVPGLSVAVFDVDGVRHATGLGARDIEARAPATADTRYSIASVTKTVTAVAILQLVERGRLSLSGEIRSYVEYWTDVPGDPITVHDVLSHSHGMPSDYVGRRELLFSETPPASPVVTDDDYVRHVNGAADRRILDPNGYMYSGFGYLILGEILEAVVERSYATYVEEEIFEPLSMDRSQVGYGDIAELGDDTITGYRIEDGEPVPNSHDLEAELRPPYSGGGILSSVTDLATLGRCLLNDGATDGARLLAEDLVAEMTASQGPSWETIDGEEIGYGYGMQTTELMGDPVAQHTGTAPGISRAYLGIRPERSLGVTLGVNTTDVPIGSIGQGVLALLEGTTPSEAVPALALRRKLSAVTGTYEGYRGGTRVRVEAADSHITVTYEQGPEWEFPAFPETTAVDDYRFYTVRPSGARDPVTFHDTADGMEFRCNVDRLDRVVE